jgi:uncharacterized membrane protein
MFGRNEGITAPLVDTAGSVKGALADLANDKQLRRRLAAGIVTAAAARRRVRSHLGVTGLARSLRDDLVLRAELIQLGRQLEAVRHRAKRKRSHKLRNAALVAGGAAAVSAAIVRLRGDGATGIQEEIDLAVPVSAAYNQWTQFEEFPRFMEGVDEVRQLDDTLLHWAATISGKHAEWDAKIVEQKPDRRIVWESTQGKNTRGIVEFEEIGAGRSRIRLNMTYAPGGISERVGSAIGLDNRRIRGDLHRFRALIEARQAPTGAWRGRINNGVETPST